MRPLLPWPMTAGLSAAFRSIRPRLAAAVRRVLARRNLLLLNPRARFGIDYLTDIERLSEHWKYDVSIFFDVGANVGDTSLAALKRFPKARVYSFEPHPATFTLLESRLGRNPMVQTERVALGLAVGSVDMFEYDASTTISSVLLNAPFATRFKLEGRRLAVPGTTLDHYCQERHLDRIDVLKIDTEGYDLNVLRGGTGMLAKGAVRFVYVEFNDLNVREGAVDGALLPIDDLLRGYGFRFIASYNDYVVTEGELFAVSNALFAAPPGASRSG
jgi:FkbM family methyltransferase